MSRIVVLGASGFLGKNMSSALENEHDVVEANRSPTSADENIRIRFDLQDDSTWSGILASNPEFIINCVGYGVVREEVDIQLMYQINYFNTVRFYDFLVENNYSGSLIHMGSAFEYDLNLKEIHESSATLPKTHYGISKLMTSNYLLDGKIKRVVILRPFNLFGAFEHETKIVPLLILSQKRELAANLSAGTQRRDYLFVNDLCNFVDLLISRAIVTSEPLVINIGSNVSLSLIELAAHIYDQLPKKNIDLWKWGGISSRLNEGAEFKNVSTKAFALGLKVTPISTGLSETIKHYWH